MSREVTLYTRSDCGLCDEALALLVELSSRLDFTISERDIDADPELTARFNDVIPVVAVGDRIGECGAWQAEKDCERCGRSQ